MFPLLPHSIEKQRRSFAMAETTDKPRLSEREHQENDQSDEIRPMEHLAHEVSNTMSVAPEAMGGHSVADLPPNYFKSIPFIATFLVCAAGL